MALAFSGWSYVDITRRTDYAIRIMLELARKQGEGPLSVRSLAEQQEVPYAFARGIQRQLVGAGLVCSTRGSKGGVTLARGASEITLLEVVTAIQGTPVCAVCTRYSDWCARMGECAVHGIWRGVDASVSEYLGRQDLASLAAGEGK